MGGLGSSPVSFPHWGHKAMEREGLLGVGVSARWAWARGRGADRNTEAEGAGEAGSAEPGRMGTVPAGGLLGNPGVPALPSTSRRGVV